MSKFYVKDDDGKNYMVEEMDEDLVENESTEETHDVDVAGLSNEELDALKRLASVADKLIAMATTVDNVEETESEEVIDTDEESEDLGVKNRDSKKSFGSIERKVEKDSVDVQESIVDAWTKRYGGR